jgi:alanine racemase
MESIQRLAPKAKILPMVKADAYGNGLIPISQHLVNECGMQKLGCASLGEALRLFQDIPTLKTEVLVFSDTEIQDPELRKYYASLPITPVLHQPSDLDAFLSDARLKDVPLVIKMNSGMNRLGFTLDELEKAIPKLKSRGVKHLLTHFATSYYPLKENDKTHRQMDEFRKAQKLLKDAGVSVEETSVSNSGAIEQKFGVEETYVRPGLMMYGPPSTEPRIWNGHQISRLVTKIIKTFPVKKGTPVGYGVNVAGEDSFVAIVPVGYGDGLLTYASGTKLMIGGLEARLFARINMDMAFLSFSPSAEGKIKTGQSVEIWNHDNRVIADIATQMKTIPYQLMCAISGRIPRIYKLK